MFPKTAGHFADPMSLQDHLMDILVGVQLLGIVGEQTNQLHLIRRRDGLFDAVEIRFALQSRKGGVDLHDSQITVSVDGKLAGLL
jgi:hypothetical protein